MGRTVPSYRMALEEEISKLKKFREALRSDDRKIFDDMIDECRLLASASGAACRPSVAEAMLLAIALSHHRSVQKIEGCLKEIRETQGK